MVLFYRAFLATWGSLVRYLPYLVVGTLLAALAQVWLNREALTRFAQRYASGSILLATLLATLTPFCSCGTMAVVLSLLAATVPWGPIVAFMVASPLMSPSEYFYAAGIMGWRFATALLLASIAVGLGAGYLAAFLERRGWLKDQARLTTRISSSPGGPTAPAGTTMAGRSCCPSVFAWPEQKFQEKGE